MSTKYSVEKIHLRPFSSFVAGDIGLFKKDYPQLWEVMTMFDRRCIKRRKGPRRSPRVNNNNNNNNNEEDAAPTNDAAANRDDGNNEGIDQSFLQPINPANIPDNVVLLGLAPKTQAEIDRAEPPNAAYRFFKELLNDAYDDYRKGLEARERGDNSEESKIELCDIVKVSCFMLSEEEVLFVLVAHILLLVFTLATS